MTEGEATTDQPVAIVEKNATAVTEQEVQPDTEIRPTSYSLRANGSARTMQPDGLREMGHEPLPAQKALRLTIKPHLQRRSHGALVHIEKFEAWLDDELFCISRQPRLDGARELLRRGYGPDVLMTTRAHDRSYDSWRPAPLGELAKWTVAEMSGRGLRRMSWRPFQNGDSMCAVDPRTRKSGLRGAQVPGRDDDAVQADEAPSARSSAA